MSRKTFTGGLNFITGKCQPLSTSKSVQTVTPEKHIQASFIAWRNIHKRQFPILNAIFSVPNGIWTHKAIAVSQVRQGLTSGIQDVICLAPSHDRRYFALLIEFKTESTSSKQSSEQLFFHDFFANLGYRTEVCRSAFDASSLVNEHLGLRIPVYPR